MELNCQHYASAASFPGKVSKVMYHRDKRYFPGIIKLFAIFYLTTP
jgi:hypothetical protein